MDLQIYEILDQDPPERVKTINEILDEDPPERVKTINEILDEDPPERFKTLISDLSNPIKRSKAESLFKLCKQTNLNTVVDKLRKLLEEDSPDIDVRKMSAILLGNIFEKSKATLSRVVDKIVNLLEHSLYIEALRMFPILFGDIYEKSEWTQLRVKDCLLNCVLKEENRPIIEILGHTISKLKPYRDVADTLFERLACNNTSVQESALLIFPQLMQFVYDCKVPYMMHLHDVFMNCLGNVGSANVRIAALIAATSFIQWLKIDGDLFQDLLPRMMQCLVEVLNGGDDAMKQKALVLLVKLAETKLSFFRGQLVEVFGSMLQIAETESLEEGTRNLAIEFVISLVKLIQTMSNNRGPDIHVLAMSAVLLGNLFKQCHPMSKSTDSRVKGYLLACVLNEENKPIIEILGHTISKLAPDNNFANLLLVNVATNLQESALLIFPHVMQYLTASGVPFTRRLRIVIRNRLGNVGSADVRIAALIAATSFIQCVMSLSDDGDWFQDLLMQCLDESFNGGDEAMTQKALFLLIELAETDARFFNRQLEVVVGSMSQIAEAENLEEGTRRLANKLRITLEKAHAVSAVVNISDNFPLDTSMPDMLEIVGNLRSFDIRRALSRIKLELPQLKNF